MTFKDLIATVKFPFQRERELHGLLRTILGFYPLDIKPYRQALMHKSITARDSHGPRLNNERLEFLGDAILDAAVADIVYRHFRRKSEGFLTTTRSKIVKRETLNRLATELGIDKLIRFDGHINNAHNSYICGNAFEALVGAIYLDRGYRRCLNFVQRRILSRLIDLDKIAYEEINFKSKLIEWGQKNRIEVDFLLASEQREGENSPTFLTHAVVEGVVCGRGKGYSKKESQQIAAHEALESLRRKPSCVSRVQEAKAHRLAQAEASAPQGAQSGEHDADTPVSLP